LRYDNLTISACFDCLIGTVIRLATDYSTMPATSDYSVHSGPVERLCNNLPQRNFSGMTMLETYEEDLNRIEPRFADRDSGAIVGTVYTIWTYSVHVEYRIR